MRHLGLRFLLAVIPTIFFLLPTSEAKSEIYGLWYDHYTNTKLEIRHTRKGIKVKHHGGWFRKWRRYDRVGRGIYDDCEGRLIIVTGYDQIKWQYGRYNRPIYLIRKSNRYNNFDRYYEYDDYDRRRGRRDYDYRNNDGYRRDRYYGDWYCSDRDLRLSIKSYGDGFRAYHGDKYSYYEPYEDHYRDQRGNRYYLDDEYLIWQNRKGNKLKFRKR